MFHRNFGDVFHNMNSASDSLFDRIERDNQRFFQNIENNNKKITAQIEHSLHPNFMPLQIGLRPNNHNTHTYHSGFDQPSFGMGFEDNDSFSSNTYGMHHNYEEQRRQKQLHEEELRLEREKEELRDEARRKEKALLAEKKRLEEIELEKIRIQEETRRQEADKLYQIELEKQRRLHAEQEVKLKLERQRLAELQRIEDEKIRAAELKAEQEREAQLRLKEDEEEKQRVINYQAHTQLIDDAFTLMFYELQQKVNALQSLKEPIERFQSSTDKGLPFKLGRIIFYAIVKNPELVPSQKLQLINTLIDEKGYQPYLNHLFSSPVLDFLLSESENLLKPLYTKAVLGLKYDVEDSTEDKIWRALLKDRFPTGCELLNVFHTKQFPTSFIKRYLEIWRATADPALLNLNSFYVNLINYFLDTQNLNIVKSIQENLVEITNSSWSTVFTISAQTKLTKKQLTDFLYVWADHLIPQNVVDFVNAYSLVITAKFDDPNVVLKHHNPLWSAIFSVDENCGEVIYANLSSLKPSSEVLILVLIALAQHAKQDKTFNYIRKNYLNYAGDPLVEGEKELWTILIKHNKDNANELLQNFIKDRAPVYKLFSFVETWLNQLDSAVQIQAAYKAIKVAIQDTRYKDYRWQLRKMAEIQVVERFREHLSSETTHWIKYSRPNFVSRLFTNTPASYDTLKAYEDGNSYGNNTLKTEKHALEEEIARKARFFEEKEIFKFKK